MTRLKKQEILFRGYFVARGMNKSLKAMDIALRIHVGKRKDGVTAEVAHQFEIVSYILQILADRVTNEILDIVISAALLHDTVEDFPELYSCEDVLRDFEMEVFEVVCLVTKSKKPEHMSSEDFLKNYYEGIVHDALSVIVKGVDRIHNIQSMVGVFKLSKMEKYIEEVENHIYPMLKTARKKYPDYFFIYINIAQLLEKQIFFIKVIIEKEKKILGFKEKMNVQFGNL